VITQLPDYKEIHVSSLVEIAADASAAIMEIFKNPFAVEKKADNSFVTSADVASHQIIESGLLKKFPDVPVLSEESNQVPYDIRKNWSRFWLVDPLDGTKEFVNRNSDFTVNIALIEKEHPVVGIIYHPLANICYVGVAGAGAFKIDKSTGVITPLQDIHQEFFTERSLVRVIASRHHFSSEVMHFVNELKQIGKHVVVVTRGSSLKFCMVAEGEADVYPRFSPTMEWDTAAAQVIVEEVGKKVLNYETRHRLSYNKVSLQNPSFIVY
jgi:3'(2'), 5'-bisphosphate nucleotidase